MVGEKSVEDVPVDVKALLQAVLDTDWYKSRPPKIQEMIKAAPPIYDYELLTDREPRGSYYQLYSYYEDGTVTAVRISKTEGIPFYRVFGLDPKDLRPWRIKS